MMQSWQFSAVDTLFFRESRPMESIGGSELGSLFPPPPRTLIGAIRTAFGESQAVDWSAFKDQSNHPLRNLIGYGDGLANLSFQGVWIQLDEQRLYPVPSNLMGLWGLGRYSELEAINFMHIGSACRCDLGKQVRLAQLPKGSEGSKPLSGYWLQAQDFELILNGQKPDKERFIASSALYKDEPRLGIARDNSLRTVKKGLLYQTRHLRLQANVSLVMDVCGLPEAPIDGSRLNRLGGEGRLAQIQIQSSQPFLRKPRLDSQNTYGLILYLLTPAFIQSKDTYQPLPQFNQSQTETGQTVWKGNLKGIGLTLHSAVISKAIREGGWNLAEHEPRAVQSLVPTGSAYYCTVDNADLQTAIDTLHGSQVGAEQPLGRGKIAVGLWLNKHNQVTREPST